jgi:hypothetical protein
MIQNSTLAYNLFIRPEKETNELFDPAELFDEQTGAYKLVYEYLDSLECNVDERVVQRLLARIRQIS